MFEHMFVVEVVPVEGEEKVYGVRAFETSWGSRAPVGEVLEFTDRLGLSMGMKVLNFVQEIAPVEGMSMGSIEAPEEVIASGAFNELREWWSMT